MSGIRVSNNSPRLNHLLFADDTIFFTQTNHQNCATLMTILNDYELASEQKINTEKSSISFSARTPWAVKDRVKHQQHIEKEGGVGKYLGLPGHFGRKKNDLFASIVDRMKQKAVSWSSRLLSTVGKMTFLQSVLSPILSFAMSCFELPKGLCKQIQSVLNRFWWDDNMDGRKKICWISWENLMKPKILGGLGIRDVKIFNQALLGKIAWRIISNPDCLLSRILIGKYCHNASFLTTTLPSSSSHGWKEILKGRDLLIKHLGKTIRNGNTTNVWKDSWIQPTSDLCLAGPPAEEQQDFLVADLLSRETKEWNVAKINNLFPELFN